MLGILGQEYAIKAFEKSYTKGRISHAYIIAGPDGVGKSLFAMYIASTLMCTGKDKPCGKCSQCIKIEHGNHPDIRVVSGTKKSIGVDDIRDVINEVYTKPYEGDRKVIIIKNSDIITVQGQNAILKTLEEPSKDTTIILTVENINLLLDTIISRCQVLKLGRIPIDTIYEFLIKKGVEKDKAFTAATLSDGIVGNGLKFLDDKFVKLRNDTIKAARDLARSGPIDALEASSFFIDNRDNIDLILDILITWYRDIIILKHVKGRENLINKDFYDFLVEEGQILSYNKLCNIIDIIHSTREKMRANANYQLAVEVMLLNIQEV